MPDQFYDMAPEDYWLVREAYYEKELDNYVMLRWAVTPIVAAWVKEFSPYKHMGLPGDDERKKRIEEQLKRKAEHIDARNLEVLRKFRENESNADQNRGRRNTSSKGSATG